MGLVTNRLSARLYSRSHGLYVFISVYWCPTRFHFRLYFCRLKSVCNSYKMYCASAKRPKIFIYPSDLSGVVVVVIVW